MAQDGEMLRRSHGHPGRRRNQPSQDRFRCLHSDVLLFVEYREAGNLELRSSR
jgi:hypothetical protein